jgi:hypothetical protein
MGHPSQMIDHNQHIVKAIAHMQVAPNIPGYGFYPYVFRPLTLVPRKRVLGVPLANEISELKA